MASAANAAEPVARPFSQALVPLFFLSALFFLNFSARVIFSPLLPGIEQEFGLDHSGAGSFFLLISSGYFISILASPFVAARLGHCWTIILSGPAWPCSLPGRMVKAERSRVADAGQECLERV